MLNKKRLKFPKLKAACENNENMTVFRKGILTRMWSQPNQTSHSQYVKTQNHVTEDMDDQMPYLSHFITKPTMVRRLPFHTQAI